ncbi:MAG TPA: RraA family protein [Verrucomicrobiae bacterium]|jgi:regulator of RNase E activity RraA|nr:RraA family protein [Verrucomicrobiae bacterium]
MTKPVKALWRNDDELFKLARRELFTAVVGDIMDQLGCRRQFLPPEIKPLREDMVLLGRAMTVLEADVLDSQETSRNPVLKKPFGLMLEALDDLKRNEIYICSGASPTYALWGELMSTRALKLGSTGAVVNGYSRDTRGILKMNFPTFSWGRYSQDQAPRGKVVDFRVPLQIGQALVQPGDIVFGDMDGVCAIPREIERDVFSRALEKARGEKSVRTALDRGMSARDAFEKYGIL